MIALSLDTWISLVVLVTALSGFYVALRREFRSELREFRAEGRFDLAATREELRSDLAATREELRSDLAATRHELRSEIRAESARLEGLILRLDDRLYAMASAAQPLPEDHPS